KAQSVMASRGKLAIRTFETGAEIQCRGDNIRVLRTRHWIAARLNVLRIASAAALAMTGQGQAPPPRRAPPSKLPSLIFDI
ncbi:MAG: hypothetical protein LBM98_07405, partial [Oscillospiraceae bacterium]|nr:hypothetical protein [Oscillospiraceae bacterium]